MNKFIGLAIATSTLMLLGGCDATGKNGSQTVDTAAITKQLKDHEAQWAKDYAARDAAAISGHYSADGAVANPGEKLFEGAAIRPMLDRFVSDPNLKLDFASDRVQVAASGDLAYTRGHFTMTATDPATRQPRTDSGYYLTVWQKQADGSWKAVEDFITPGAPAAAEPSAG